MTPLKYLPTEAAGLRAKNAETTIGRHERYASIPLGEISRWIKDNFKLRRNMNGDLEIDNELITESDRSDIHCVACEQFGNVSRHTIEKVLTGIKEATHLEFDLFPARGFVKGIRYDLLYVYRDIGLHRCSDGKFRIRCAQYGIGTTTVSGDLYDAIEAYNRVMDTFRYQNKISIHHLNNI
jgi:hypothetical protein